MAADLGTHRGDPSLSSSGGSRLRTELVTFPSLPWAEITSCPRRLAWDLGSHLGLARGWRGEGQGAQGDGPNASWPRRDTKGPCQGHQGTEPFFLLPLRCCCCFSGYRGHMCRFSGIHVTEVGPRAKSILGTGGTVWSHVRDSRNSPGGSSSEHLKPPGALAGKCRDTG